MTVKVHKLAFTRHTKIRHSTFLNNRLELRDEAVVRGLLILTVANYLFLHQIKGTPWQLLDQGKARRMTAWEQIDYGQQFTTTRKFITIIPIVLVAFVRARTLCSLQHASFCAPLSCSKQRIIIATVMVSN
ncbi:ORM1-like protein 3 [Portunus trituberculatus]|uniref:ORM1-like protein 3 n=1 Tax=Portunus trituberculatus TaxID=210409 RepID=A0A5B7D0X0_PORTR|nr:ORM1-like protein 3 [Portunus trituberculatus]